jgi:hypothetical protein
VQGAPIGQDVRRWHVADREPMRRNHNAIQNGVIQAGENEDAGVETVKF